MCWEERQDRSTTHHLLSEDLQVSWSPLDTHTHTHTHSQSSSQKAYQAHNPDVLLIRLFKVIYTLVKTAKTMR